MKKLVIFDLDGTILDTLPDLKNSVNYVLKNYGFIERTTEEIKSFVGNGIELLMRRALPIGITEEEFKIAFSLFKNHYEKNIQNETKPYPNILKLMEKLKNEDFLIAVVSNKFQAGVDELIEHYFNDYVSLAVGTSDTVRAKPEIDAIELVFEKLQIQTNDKVYFVGDSEVDIQTAKNAKIQVIAVSWGFRPVEELKRHQPDFLVEEAFEIFDIVK